jgi:hypothetical protein
MTASLQCIEPQSQLVYANLHIPAFVELAETTRFGEVEKDATIQRNQSNAEPRRDAPTTGTSTWVVQVVHDGSVVTADNFCREAGALSLDRPVLILDTNCGSIGMKVPPQLRPHSSPSSLLKTKTTTKQIVREIADIVGHYSHGC